jgi:hypothetical protein
MNYVPDMMRIITRNRTLLSFISTCKRELGTVISVLFSTETTNVAFARLPILLRIREVLGTNLGQKEKYCDRFIFLSPSKKKVALDP